MIAMRCPSAPFNFHSSFNYLSLTLTQTDHPISFSVGEKMATIGAIRESEVSANSLEIDALARFALDDHNKKQNSLLEFKKVSSEGASSRGHNVLHNAGGGRRRPQQGLRGKGLGEAMDELQGSSGIQARRRRLISILLLPYYISLNLNNVVSLFQL
ncbi:hypothetical protein SASPL_129448 [Salvia splendens]|uniref:Cysteine proteinase inhibitor n=1 Tax=Salvia splendens TaxID=180675 RepID=A0A8X8XED2_SALSN|nr:hypothetical protein SASPL_129448 [Salvia splendens]